MCNKLKSPQNKLSNTCPLTKPQGMYKCLCVGRYRYAYRYAYMCIWKLENKPSCYYISITHSTLFFETESLTSLEIERLDNQKAPETNLSLPLHCRDSKYT